MLPERPKEEVFPVLLNVMDSMAARKLMVVTATEFQGPSVAVLGLQRLLRAKKCRANSGILEKQFEIWKLSILGRKKILF